MGVDRTGQRKNYPIFWEGKGKGNPQLKKNEKRNFFNRKTCIEMLINRFDDEELN